MFWVAAGIFFLLTFGSVTIDEIQIGSNANVHELKPGDNFFHYVNGTWEKSAVIPPERSRIWKRSPRCRIATRRNC